MDQFSTFAGFWHYASLVPTILALKLFNSAVTRGRIPYIYTSPFIGFSWLYFAVAPFCNMAFDTYVDSSLFLTEPADAIAILNITNALGLLCGSLTVALLPKRTKPSRRRHFEINYSHLSALCSVALIASVSYGTYFLYISPNFQLDEFGRLIIAGSIYQFMLFECAPLLFCWAVSSHFINKRSRPTLATGILIILIHFALVLAFSSSRGSRVAMLVQLIIAAQVFHFTIVRIRPIFAIVAIFLVAILLPVYAHYKYGGLEGIADYLSGRAQTFIEDRYNDPVRFIVGDVGRADIQAPILHGLLTSSVINVTHGETYLSAVFLLLPRPLRPTFLRSKAVLGAHVQEALNPSYIGLSKGASGEPESSRIYGILGESLINFGLWGIPISFVILGILVTNCFRMLKHRNSSSDSLFNPYLSLLPIYLLFYDLDNIIFQSIVVWGLPSGIYLICGALHRKTPGNDSTRFL